MSRICPFCGKPLIQDKQRSVLSIIYRCSDEACFLAHGCGEEDLWAEISRTKSPVEQAVKAANNTLNNELMIAISALFDVNKILDEARRGDSNYYEIDSSDALNIALIVKNALNEIKKRSAK